MKKKFFRTAFRISLWMLLGFILLLTLLLLLHWQTNVVSKALEHQLNRILKDQATISYSDIKGVLFDHVRIEDLEIRVGEMLYIRTDYLELK
jgi:autotransporter translocation and assembly factor TamB